MDRKLQQEHVASLSWTPRELAERLAAQMTEYREQVGHRLVRFREAKGWNQEDLAYHAGVSNRTVQRIERGQHDGRIKTIQRLADALDITEAELRGQPPAGTPTVAERLDDLAGQVKDLRDAVLHLTADNLRLHTELQELIAMGRRAGAEGGSRR